MSQSKYPEGVPLSIIREMGKMREAGETLDFISQSFGVGITTVKRHMAKHGYKKLVSKPRKMIKPKTKQFKARNPLPQSDIAHINGSNYKRGVHGLIFRESGSGWTRSAMTGENFQRYA